MHLPAVQWFRATFPYVLGFHVPNGEKRDRRTAELLQRMGVLPGVADWLMFPDGVKVAVELKAKAGVLSNDQLRFQSAWCRMGGIYEVARTLEEFQKVCRSYCVHYPWHGLRNDNPRPADLPV